MHMTTKWQIDMDTYIEIKDPMSESPKLRLYQGEDLIDFDFSNAANTVTALLSAIMSLCGEGFDYEYPDLSDYA